MGSASTSVIIILAIYVVVGSVVEFLRKGVCPPDVLLSVQTRHPANCVLRAYYLPI